MVVFTLLAFILLISFYYPRRNHIAKKEIPESYSINFANWTLNSLLQNEWYIKDKDTTLLERYGDSSFLTLGTEVGDYFLQYGETKRIEIIRNLLYRKISCGSCCTITLKLSNFHPYQAYQQAGFLLFYTDTINRRYYTRLTYSFENKQDTTTILPLFYDYYSRDYAINGPRALSPIQLPTREDHDLTTDSIWLKVDIRDNVYAFSYKRNGFNEYKVTKGHLMNLPMPKLIAIGAWQGHSASHSNVSTVDIIPVTFDSLVIEPCNNKQLLR